MYAGLFLCINRTYDGSMKTLLKILIATQLMLLSSLSLAQIPETQHSQGISYITGGVGEGETVAILAEAKQ